jgi:hypothetical protein
LGFNPIDLARAAAQGNPNPRAHFCNHAIVRFNGAYYDPSYGTGPFASPTAWEDASLDGFGAYVRDAAGAYLYKERLDPKGSQQTTFNP